MTLDLELIYTSVPLDYNVSLCKIQATYQAVDGTPMAGTVTFTPAPLVITDVDANVIFYQTPINVALDEDGSINVELIATDDPDLNPWNWTWTVSENLTWNETTYTNSYSIEAPSNNIIDLADVVPIPDYTGTPIVRGTPGVSLGYKVPGSYPYTVIASDHYLSVDTSVARVINLPSANSFSAGNVLVIKDTTGGAVTHNITVNRAGADLIDGATSKVISTAYGNLKLMCNGTNGWEVW